MLLPMNLSHVCQQLADAISQDCSESITPPALLSLFEERAVAEGYGSLLTKANGSVLIAPATMFAMYAEWIIDVGVALGYAAIDDEIADAWITDAMPTVKAVTCAIREDSIRALGELDDALQRARGYRATEVLLLSLESGEPVAQSGKRLHALRHGLKVVK